MPRTVISTHNVVSHSVVPVWEVISNRNVQMKESIVAELFYLLSKASDATSNFASVLRIPISSSSSFKHPATR